MLMELASSLSWIWKPRSMPHRGKGWSVGSSSQDRTALSPRDQQGIALSIRLQMDYRSVRVEGDSSEPFSRRANHYRSIDRLCLSILPRFQVVQQVVRQEPK